MNGRRLPTSPRSVSHVRRQPVRRSSPRLRSVQSLAGGLMAACLRRHVRRQPSRPSFAARTLEIHGATFTGQSIIRSILGMDGAPNVFRIETDRAAATAGPAARRRVGHRPGPPAVDGRGRHRRARAEARLGHRRQPLRVDQDGLLFGLVDSAGNPIPSNAGPIATPTATASSSASAPRRPRPAAPTPPASPTPNHADAEPDAEATRRRTRRSRRRRPRPRSRDEGQPRALSPRPASRRRRRSTPR